MIRGGGELRMIAKPGSPGAFSDFYFPPCYAMFTFSSTQENSNAEYLNLVGVNQKLSSQISKESFFIDLVFEDVDFMTMQVALGELSAKTDDVQLYEFLEICPLMQTFVEDDRITEELITDLGVYNETDHQIMIQVTDIAELNPNRFFYNPINGRLIFNSTELGKAISIKIPVVKDDIACIGGESENAEFYDYSFQGSFLTTAGDGPYYIEVPNLRRITAPVTSLSGDKAVYNIKYQAVCGDQDAFERKPFRIYSPTSGVPLGVFNILLESGDNLLLEDGGLLLTEESG